MPVRRLRSRTGMGATPAERQPHQEPATGTRLSAREIQENILEPAEEELERSARSLVLSALAGGLLIGFGFLGSGYLRSVAPPGLGTALAAVAYPIGYIFVVFGRNELFTEHTLEPILPLLEKRDRDTLLETLRLWGAVIFGNVVGAAGFGVMVALTPVVDEPLRPALAAVAEHGSAGGFGFVLYRAVFAGWLVALMTWLLASTHATGAQIALVWLTTAPISALGLRHSITGTVDATYRVATGALPLADAIGSFLVPAIVGNAIGGILFVALLNYGQVVTNEGLRRV